MSALYNLVIPMAGLGSRFANAGYLTPKPLLPVGGFRMFEVVTANFANSGLAEISFVAPASFHLRDDLNDLSRKLDVQIHLVEVDGVTSGPAESAALALERLTRDYPVVIANSDQYLDFDSGKWIASCIESLVAGSILCMRDSDPKWSFARLGESGLVEEVAEKRVISDLATCGVYYFDSSKTFMAGYAEMVALDEKVNDEFYVAPIYNRLIASGLSVSAHDLGPVSEVMFGLGIPSDYEDFLASGFVSRTDKICNETFSRPTL